MEIIELKNKINLEGEISGAGVSTVSDEDGEFLGLVKITVEKEEKVFLVTDTGWLKVKSVKEKFILGDKIVVKNGIVESIMRPIYEKKL